MPDTDVSAWTKSDLQRYVGGLSNPSKMPGYGYSLPAQECITGSKLRVVEGTVCNECYALKNRFLFPKVKGAMYRRLEALFKPLWVKAMAELISRTGNQHFRWHDSGDLQSVAHLARIVAVCNLTPEVRHWLPTREYEIVQRYVIKGGVVPPNLTIRVSAHKINGPAPEIKGVVASTVSTQPAIAGQTHRWVHRCPSPTQGNNCGDCRACWDPGVKVVEYHLH